MAALINNYNNGMNTLNNMNNSANALNQDMNNLRGNAANVLNQNMNNLSGSLNQNMNNLTGSLNQNMNNLTGSLNQNMNNLSGSLNQNMNNGLNGLNQNMNNGLNGLNQNMTKMQDNSVGFLKDATEMLHSGVDGIKNFNNVISGEGTALIADLGAVATNNAGVVAEVEARQGIETVNHGSEVIAKEVTEKFPEIKENLNKIMKGFFDVKNSVSGAWNESNLNAEIEETRQKENARNIKLGIYVNGVRKENQNLSQDAVLAEAKKRLEEEEEETQKEAKVTTAVATGGSRRRVALKNIQRGGKLAAKRTQKSIHEFLKPSITASYVLNMIQKRKTKKRRRYTSNKKNSKRQKRR